MSVTRIRTLVVLALIAGATGWALVTLMHSQSGRILPVPWLAAVTMWVLAIVVLIWALVSRPRLLRKPKARPMPPLMAARTVALAMAASRVGSLVAGFYGGIAIATIPSRFTPAGTDTLWAGAAAALGSAALAAAALWLERMCRLPEGGDGAQPG